MSDMFKEISIMWNSTDTKLKVYFVKGDHAIDKITEREQLLFNKEGISGWEFELNSPIEDELRVLKYIGNLVDNICDEYLKDNNFDIKSYESPYWKRMKLGQEAVEHNKSELNEEGSTISNGFKE